MSHIKDFTLLFTMNRMSPRLDMEAFFLKMEANFTLGLDTKTFFERLKFDIFLSTMNLKWRKNRVETLVN